MASVGPRFAHTMGRSGWPNNAQRQSGNSCRQRTPAGLPSSMPGIGDEIDGAIQPARQFVRQSMYILTTDETDSH